MALCDADKLPEGTGIPNLMSYEAWMGQQPSTYAWPALNENTACSLCYTSGTTGNPKGALYSHRSTVLHAYAAALPDSMCISARDSILPVVPMFHVNAWGIPYSAAIAGAKATPRSLLAIADMKDVIRFIGRCRSTVPL